MSPVCDDLLCLRRHGDRVGSNRHDPNVVKTVISEKRDIRWPRVTNGMSCSGHGH